VFETGMLIELFYVMKKVILSMEIK
jgi:hypothetical protein